MELGFQIVGDAETDLPPDSSRRAILLGAGLRSSLRVPVRLEGRIVGALSFHATDTGRYGEEDVELAGRVADQVALAFSHQRLAEEAKRAEEARREAARLEARVQALSDELESRDGFGRIVGASPAWRAVLVHASKVAPTETTVLLTGDSGTGKEVVARAVHRASRPERGPVRRSQLRGPPRTAPRIRAVRLREGRFHRRLRFAREAGSSRRREAPSSSTRWARRARSSRPSSSGSSKRGSSSVSAERRC